MTRMPQGRLSELALELAEIQEFRLYLRQALIAFSSQQGRVNLAEFSRRAGFASRSYLSEILSGRKGLSRDALRSIRDALKLPKPILNLLELLAYQSDMRLAPREINKNELKQKIASARQNVRALALKPDASTRVSSLVRRPVLFQIFAALGTVDTGASLEEIVGRTGIKLLTVQSALEFLINEKVVSRRDGRFYALTHQLDFLGLKEKDGVTELISEVCEKIRRQRKSITEDPNSVAVYSAFSISKDRMKLFATQLREAVFEVLDRFQDDSGDQVEQVFVCLYRNANTK